MARLTTYIALRIVLNTFDQPIVVLPPGKKKQLEELALRGQCM